MKTTNDFFSSHSHTPALKDYLAGLSAADGGYAAHVAAAMERDGVRAASVTPMEGKLLETLARLSGAKKAVEIGTLYGYSAHWLARGLPEGARLYTLERDPAAVNAAKDGVEASALTRKVTVMEGPAADSLKTLAKLGPHDLCYIDADVRDYPACVRWAAANLRPGGLVLAANAFYGGQVCYEGDDAALTAGARAMREFFHVLFDADRFVSACVIPTGAGLALAVKKAEEA